MATIEAIDLFCGVGGLSTGLINAGIDVIAGFDVDADCRYPFEANHPGAAFLLRDVGELSGKDLQTYWCEGAVRLLAGCAPCQPFSSYARTKAIDHKKWGMLFHFARLVDEAQPELVTMENVPGLVGQEPFEHFLRTLEAQQYQIAYGVINGADYGVPQLRKRLVLIASRIGSVEMPRPTHIGPGAWLTVRDVIGDLPPLKDGEFDVTDPLHRAAKLSVLNKKRIRVSTPGGTWRDWPKHLVAKCHQKESGKNSTGIYGRMQWDCPAPTMTTLCNGYGNGRFGHPEQDRGISLREAAIFQSFPIDYKFIEPGRDVSTKSLSRMIGNAVPPKLSEAIGSVLVQAANRS